MEARHTTGPWKFGHMMDGERWWIGQEYDCLPVAFVDRHDWPEAVVAANLRVIAAAPALLKALRPFVDAYQKAADPIGDSDLYDEQPRHVTVTLGDCRRAATAIIRATKELS